MSGLDRASTSATSAIDLRERSIANILGAQAPSGAFVAAPTYEQYRYAWLRDGAFIADALRAVGELGAAGRFHDWVGDVVSANATGIERAIAAAGRGEAPDPADYLHCRYTVDGAAGRDDWPTFQLDGPGIWLWSFRRFVATGGRPSGTVMDAVALVARYLAALWQQPSYDAWEEHPEHVHTSTLGAELAGLQAAIALGVIDEVVPRAAEDIVREVRGRAAADGWLPKWPGNPAVDGSLLWLATLYGVLERDDPIWQATLSRVEHELTSVDGGVYRYRADTYYGGGEWLLLTASLGLAYVQRGRPGDREFAEAALRWIESQADRAGNLPEQVDCHALHPERIGEWRARWGESANPLIWSHAMYLLLLASLAPAA